MNEFSCVVLLIMFIGCMLLLSLNTTSIKSCEESGGVLVSRADTIGETVCVFSGKNIPGIKR